MARRKYLSARAVKIWLDVVFFAGIAVGGLLLLWLVFSPMIVGRSGAADAAVKVFVGDGSLIPVLSLESAATERIRSLHLAKAQGELRFQTGAWWLPFVTNSLILCGIGIALWVIHFLPSVHRSVLEGDPFSARNASRIRIVATIFILTGLIVPLVEYFLARWVLGQLLVQEFPLSAPLDFRLDAIVVGLLILSLASVFDHGVELEEEKSLTISSAEFRHVRACCRGLAAPSRPEQCKRSVPCRRG